MQVHIVPIYLGLLMIQRPRADINHSTFHTIHATAHVKLFMKMTSISYLNLKSFLLKACLHRRVMHY